MQQGRGDAKEQPGHRRPRHHGQHPETGHRDVQQRLERIPPETFHRPVRPSGPQQAEPSVLIETQVIKDQRHHRQRRDPPQRPPIRLARSYAPDVPQQHQPQRKAHRKKELRHDCIRVAAIRVVMLQHRRNRREPACKIDKKHPSHRVATELVERLDASLGHDVKKIPWGHPQKRMQVPASHTQVGRAPVS